MSSDGSSDDETAPILGVTEPKKNDLSTIQGVYVPCILGIIGVILFERLGWVVGQSGVIVALAIMFTGFFVVTLTTLSLSAIATNGKMKGGGAYYMISRSLGPEFGGSIGILFYFANVAGCGVYLRGFLDALTLIPIFSKTTQWTLNFYGLIVLFAELIICLIGARLYAKTAIFIFVIQWVSMLGGLGSFWFLDPSSSRPGFTSWSLETFSDNVYSHYDTGENFSTVFGVFFPAVTGIMAGANMSGDLKNAAKSIPNGTLGAIATTALFYAIFLISEAFTVRNSELKSDFYIMGTVTFWQPLWMIGILASTVSSMLGNLIGSARIIQAIARDKLIPVLYPFSAGSAGRDEPRRALLLSFVVVVLTLLIPNLNAIATITSLLFLYSYGAVNFACFVLSVSGAPNFRPTWKYFSWWTSLLGGVLCLFAMFYIDPLISSVSVFLFIVLFISIHFWADPTSWGDVSQALIYHQVRKYLLRLDVRKSHIKHWRPQILLLVKRPRSIATHNLLSFTNDLKKGGLYVIASVQIGDRDNQGSQMKLLLKGWNDLIDFLKLKAFAEMVISEKIVSGARTLFLTAGMGAMKPNTIIFGFYGDSENHKPIIEKTPIAYKSKIAYVLDDFELDNNRKENHFFDENQITLKEYVQMIRDALFFEKNVIIARHFEYLDKNFIVEEKKTMTIDLWPIIQENEEGYLATISLILLFGWITRNKGVGTKQNKLRLFHCVNSDSEIESEKVRLKNFLKLCRIKCQILVLNINKNDQNLQNFDQTSKFEKINHLMKENSSTTGLLFTSLSNPPQDPLLYEDFFENLKILTHDLPPILLIYSKSETGVISTDI